MYDEAMKSIGGPLIAKRKWGTFVKKANATRNPEAIVAYRGPVHWWESGTSAHLIVSRKLGGSRKSRGAMSPGPGMFKGKRGAVSTPAGPHARGSICRDAHQEGRHGSHQSQQWR